MEDTYESQMKSQTLSFVLQQVPIKTQQRRDIPSSSASVLSPRLSSAMTCTCGWRRAAFSLPFSAARGKVLHVPGNRDFMACLLQAAIFACSGLCSLAALVFLPEHMRRQGSFLSLPGHSSTLGWQELSCLCECEKEESRASTLRVEGKGCCL